MSESTEEALPAATPGLNRVPDVALNELRFRLHGRLYEPGERRGTPQATAPGTNNRT